MALLENYSNLPSTWCMPMTPKLKKYLRRTCCKIQQLNLAGIAPMGMIGMLLQIRMSTSPPSMASSLLILN